MELFGRSMYLSIHELQFSMLFGLADLSADTARANASSLPSSGARPLRQHFYSAKPPHARRFGRRTRFPARWRSCFRVINASRFPRCLGLRTCVRGHGQGEYLSPFFPPPSPRPAQAAFLFSQTAAGDRMSRAVVGPVQPVSGPETAMCPGFLGTFLRSRREVCGMRIGMSCKAQTAAIAGSCGEDLQRRRPFTPAPARPCRNRKHVLTHQRIPFFHAIWACGLVRGQGQGEVLSPFLLLRRLGLLRQRFLFSQTVAFDRVSLVVILAAHPVSGPETVMFPGFLRTCLRSRREACGMRIGMGCKAQTAAIAGSYGEDLQRRGPPKSAPARPRRDRKHVLTSRFPRYLGLRTCPRTRSGRIPPPFPPPSPRPAQAAFFIQPNRRLRPGVASGGLAGAPDFRPRSGHASGVLHPSTHPVFHAAWACGLVRGHGQGEFFFPSLLCRPGLLRQRFY